MAHDLIFPDITFITMSNEPEKVRGLIRKLNNVKVNHVFVVDKREKFKFLENYQNYVVIETKSKHFAYLLNLGIFYAKTKWVMEVDSDEELDENLLLSLTNLDDECDYYTVKKKALFMGKSYNYLTRNFVVIIKKNLCYYNGAVNERTNTKKLKGCHLNGELTNNSYDDWNVYWRKFYKYAKLHKKSFHDFFRRLMGEIYIYFKTNAFVDGIISIKFLVYGLLFVFVSEIIGRSDYLFLTLPEIEQKIENDRQNYDLREVEYILFAIEKIKKNDLGIKFNFFEELEQVSSALS